MSENRSFCRQVHIGCDEARIGLARSRGVVEERGAGPVYLDYVRRVHELVRRRGRTTQLWGDVLISHPELAAELPADAIPVMENYGADAPFDTYAETCVQAGLPFYLSPGINCWNTIIGNTATALTNIRRAGESAVRHGAVGLLNTHWGDNGHWQHLPVAFPGYALGAASGWAPVANADLDLPAALDMHAFRDSAGVMGRLVCELGDVSRCHDAVAGSHGPLTAWILIGLPGLLEQLAGLTEEALGMAGERLEQVIAPLVDDFRRLWLRRDRPGGLHDSTGRFERLLAVYRGEGRSR